MRSKTRSGRLVSPFLTKTTPDLSKAFATMVSPGTKGSGIEQALGAISAAISEPLISTTNLGFIRPDADFAIVIVGDEDDQSTLSLKQLALDLRALKGELPITVASAIGLDSSFLCWLGGEEQWRIADFTRQFKTNGLLAICRDDYSEMLRSIAGRVVNGRCIVGLQKPLVPGRKVHVTVNGAPSTFVANKPDENFKNGSIEVTPCLSSGSTVAIAYDVCP